MRRTGAQSPDVETKSQDKLISLSQLGYLKFCGRQQKKIHEKPNDISQKFLRLKVRLCLAETNQSI
jgi:hypothetical protein